MKARQWHEWLRAVFVGVALLTILLSGSCELSSRKNFAGASLTVSLQSSRFNQEEILKEVIR